MGFLTPLALALAGLALPILIFYMLKLRRQPARISSLMLWQQVIRDRQANAPWQRLRRNLLLLLQLLILALLVMALARPYFTVQARVQGNVVLLLDASASMQATDVAPSRFAAAQVAALDLVDRLAPDDTVTVIAVERTPRVLASTSTDRISVRQTLTAARPSAGPADWDAALILAAANAATRPNTTVVVISDGALNQGQDEAATSLAALPVPTQFIPIGQAAHNQGIVALSVRDGQAGPELFVRVANAEAGPSRRLIEVYVDDQLFDARQLELPAQDSVGLALNGLPLQTHHIRASLSGNDDLALDDVAWVVRSSAPARLLLVSAGNLFLERALALLPNVTVQRATPDQELPNARFDLVIFDRVTPAEATLDNPDGLPEANLLFIAPPNSTSLFDVTGVVDRPQVTQIERQHPLLTYVELNNLHLGQAQAVTPPPWGQTLIAAPDTPLLIAGQAQGRRVAVLTFDLHQSDLPLQIDFPILMLNLIHWLLPGGSLEQGQMLQVGQTVDLPAVSAAEALQIRTPSARQLSVSPAQITFDDTAELGVYQVLAKTPDQAEPTLLTEFAVNLLAEAETDLQPRSLEPGSSPAHAAGQPLTGRWEWWWLLVGGGLGLVMLEWWVYWRGEVR